MKLLDIGRGSFILRRMEEELTPALYKYLKKVVNYNRDSEKEVVFFSEPAVTMGLMNFKDN